MPVTVEYRASDCWIIVPATVEQSHQWLLKNCATHCWRIVQVIVEEFCQRLLKNYASDCWTVVPVTVEELCQWLLNNHAKRSKLVKEHFPRYNFFHKIFNKNTIKISYSSMRNISSITASHINPFYVEKQKNMVVTVKQRIMSLTRSVFNTKGNLWSCSGKC